MLERILLTGLIARVFGICGYYEYYHGRCSDSSPGSGGVSPEDGSSDANYRSKLLLRSDIVRLPISPPLYDFDVPNCFQVPSQQRYASSSTSLVSSKRTSPFEDSRITLACSSPNSRAYQPHAQHTSGPSCALCEAASYRPTTGPSRLNMRYRSYGGVLGTTRAGN